MQLPPIDAKPWALGISGGADSVALLYRMLEAGVPVRPLHFNHGFEDENGDNEEIFVRALCENLHLPLIVGRCTDAESRTTSKEVFARQCRFAFFKAHAQGKLLLAHHANDRAENLILRLMRGCGLEGLTSFGIDGCIEGMQIFRPLLDETHQDQVDWLTARGYTWMEDPSNNDTHIPRNLIRHTLRKALPTFTSGANTSLDVLTEENAFLARLTQDAIESQSALHLRMHVQSEPVLKRRALVQWLKARFNHTPTRRQMELLDCVGAVIPLRTDLRVRHTLENLWEALL